MNRKLIVRDENGKYAENPRQLSRKTRYTFLLVLIAVTMFVVWFLPKVIFVNNYNPSDTATSTVIDLTPEKITKIQDNMLDELSLGCETKGVAEPDSALLLDSNNQMSIGRFQFQIKTVQYYVKKFDNKDINRHDAIILALDAVQAKELARKIVFSGNGLVGNWTNCSNAHQLSKEVDVIKSFMKI